MGFVQARPLLIWGQEGAGLAQIARRLLAKKTSGKWLYEILTHYQQVHHIKLLQKFREYSGGIGGFFTQNRD